MRARNPLYIMAKPPPAQQARITALPRNDPSRGPHLLHVTLAALFDLHYAPPEWLPQVIAALDSFDGPAFPLAFDFGDSGAVIAMLGLLICSCAAGWGMMAARRVGSTWPGLPARGSGRRPDWRVVAAYAVMVAAVVALAVWRVARLR